jgi:hypothetical protein
VPVPPTERIDAVITVLSAGYIGCPHGEIEIADYHVARFDRSPGDPNVSETWTARCRGLTFFCSAGTGGRLACTPEIPPRASSTTPTATPDPSQS